MRLPMASIMSSGVSMESAVNPTTVTDDYWVWASPPAEVKAARGRTLGKWLVFRDFDRLDETWQQIRKAVESGELGATGAKSSTARDKPSSKGQGTQSGVICVYTSENSMDEVGLKLIYMVKHDIKYKTDAATLMGLYTSRGHGKVSCRTIYWNGGDPSFESPRPKKSSSGSGKAAIRQY